MSQTFPPAFLDYLSKLETTFCKLSLRLIFSRHFFTPLFFLLQLNHTYMKQILHLRNVTFKSSYNWFKIDIHQQLRPLTANYETPMRPPPFMGNTILNFRFDYLHPSLNRFVPCAASNSLFSSFICFHLFFLLKGFELGHNGMMGDKRA